MTADERTSEERIEDLVFQSLIKRWTAKRGETWTAQRRKDWVTATSILYGMVLEDREETRQARFAESMRIALYEASREIEDPVVEGELVDDDELETTT